jgi:hypothetical protein
VVDQQEIRLTVVAFIGVKSRSKTMNVTYSVGGSAASGDSGKSHEDRGFLISRVQKGSIGNVRPVSVGDENAMCSGTASVYSFACHVSSVGDGVELPFTSLWDSLMVEMSDLSSWSASFDLIRQMFPTFCRLMKSSRSVGPRSPAFNAS